MSWVGHRSRPIRRRLTSLSANQQVATFMEGQLVELTEEELKEADHEVVRYRRQARVEGAYAHVGLLAVSMRCRRATWSDCGVDANFVRPQGW